MTLFFVFLDQITTYGGLRKGASHITPRNSWKSRMSKNSTQSWYCLPGNSIRFHQLRVPSYRTDLNSPTSDTSHNPGYHLCFWQTEHRSEVPTTSSLGSINSLGPLTEFRETFFLLDYQFILKGCNSASDIWKRCIGYGMGKRLWATVGWLSLFSLVLVPATTKNWRTEIQ